MRILIASAPLVAMIMVAACASSATGQLQASGSYQPTPGRLYRLETVGTPDGLAQVRDLRRQELRAGWLVQRGNEWLAVDTVSVVRRGPPPAFGVEILHGEPPVVVADSGWYISTRGDSTIYLVSQVGPQVVPNGGTVGIIRGDTLKLFSGRPTTGPFRDFERIRIYVRVR